ncbi:MAG: ATP-binding protein [Pseudomonadota bacterium]
MQASALAELIDALPIPVLWIGSNERVLAINAAAIELLGRVLPGRHYITALRQPLVLDCIETTLTSGAPKSAKYLSSRQGKSVSYDVHTEPVSAEDQPGVLVTFQDTTHLEEAGQIRRDFVANVSHELRTPLTAMSGFIETLRGAARDDPAARERFLEIMAKETERMNRLVQDLLSLSRVEGAERQRPTDLVDLDEVLHYAIDHVTRSAEDAGVSIDISRPDDAFEAKGDRDQLVQVFINLLENGIKYGAAGGRIDVVASKEDYAVPIRAPAYRIDVKDYGEGIDRVHLPRLTERFYRVDDHRSRDMGGTGLGLAIVKHIVNRHRGRLQIDSEPGQGTNFSVFLPV